MQRLALVLVVALMGCAQTPQQRAEIVCMTFCDCLVGPAAVQNCVDTQCLPQVKMPVSDACFDCVNQHESVCTTLESTCAATCF
jgi:hypothetical protein